MIPLHLRVSGFLSYRDPVELNFDSFELACISGNNGAGKSSLLDSITWVLFGEARGKGMDVVNLHQDVKAAEVALTFEYEGNIYRVQRTLPRGKSAILEFQVLDNGQRTADDGKSSIFDGQWKPLTEKTTRDTQTRIEQTLRLDYETFVNASFFLQGKADQFTQKKASERKTVLSTILGLEVWDVYKNRAAERRKLLENDVNEIDGRIAEIDAELSEEEVRKSRLDELQRTLNQLSAGREAQESALETIKKNAALIDEQRKLTTTLSAALGRLRATLASSENRLVEKENEQANYTSLLNRAREIESTYKAWQKSRRELEAWDQTALEFREYDKKRQPLLREIDSERARLQQERDGALLQEKAVNDQASTIDELEKQIKNAARSLKDAEEQIANRMEMESNRNEAREKHAGLKVENETLRREMEEHKSRIEALEKADGAICPVCGQELSEGHRKSTLKELNKDGKEKGDRFRANKKEIEEVGKQVANYELQISKLANLENERVKYSNSVSQLNARHETVKTQITEWEKGGAKRIKEITKLLESEKYAAEAQKELAKLDKELTKLGYDVSTHEMKRKEELELRGVEDEYRNLDTARQVSKQIESEIANLKSEIAKRRSEIGEQETAYNKTAKELARSESQSPDLNEAERKLFELREEENRTRDQAGAARQKVDVLAALRDRKKDYNAQKEELNQQILRHKALERAFGKDGVPALLIEQALPQIEQKANDLLERLSDGQMSIRFVTQAEYRDKKRDDLKETLDIQISDGAGLRDYEMYSGGEAFRVNFAIRLALSEILAQRKGARLQTLVIDEGFGSQDVQGRQRLIEAINIVKNDFAKILIITHLDELKDAFPNRIEVEKTERGSSLRVI